MSAAGTGNLHFIDSNMDKTCTWTLEVVLFSTKAKTLSINPIWSKNGASKFPKSN